MAEGLRDQYDRAVAEYRFQVDLNWRRSEYFFVLNIGLLVASATLFASSGVPRELVCVLFMVGALLAVLSLVANGVQHGYYRAARDLKTRLEKKLGLQEVALATTPGMGSPIQRIGKVGTFLRIMLVAIAAADITGAAFALDDALASSGGNDEKREVLLRVTSDAGQGQWVALVVSQDGTRVQSKRLSRNGSALVDLTPGSYLVSVAGNSLCERLVTVRAEPLQLQVVRC